MGEEGLVQLRLEEEIAVKRGDRFVVRFYSPMETIGGGIVLEPNPVRKKRFDAQAIEELKKKRIRFTWRCYGASDQRTRRHDDHTC